MTRPALYVWIAILIALASAVALDIWLVSTNQATLSNLWLRWTRRVGPVLTWAAFGLVTHLCIPREAGPILGEPDSYVLLGWLGWGIFCMGLGDVAQKVSPWVWAALGTLSWWLLFPQTLDALRWWRG